MALSLLLIMLNISVQLDDNLLAEASRLASVQDQELLIKMALREFINNHQASKFNMLDLYGIGGISEDYDYKQLRGNENNDLFS